MEMNAILKEQIENEKEREFVKFLLKRIAIFLLLAAIGCWVAAYQWN
jgi:hypothetical protein